MGVTGFTISKWLRVEFSSLLVFGASTHKFLEKCSVCSIVSMQFGNSPNWCSYFLAWFCGLIWLNRQHAKIKTNENHSSWGRDAFWVIIIGLFIRLDGIGLSQSLLPAAENGGRTYGDSPLLPSFVQPKIRFSHENGIWICLGGLRCWEGRWWWWQVGR